MTLILKVINTSCGLREERVEIQNHFPFLGCQDFMLYTEKTIRYEEFSFDQINEENHRII